jgi:hypothetical protein
LLEKSHVQRRIHLAAETDVRILTLDADAPVLDGFSVHEAS